jgi:hypothetical protein
MAAPGKKRDGGGGFEQDPHVDRLRPDPSSPPAEVVILEGLAGNSDRDGWARVYLSTSLNYYAEIRREDIVYSEPIPPEQPPMKGLKCTRVGVKKDAVIEYTRATRARVLDEFDLDIRLGMRAALQAQCVGTQEGTTCAAECPGGGTGINQTCLTCVSCGDTCQITICRGATCIDVCETRIQTACDQATCETCRTCETCQTRCNQPTCQATCNTCGTQCGQATCATCQTQCGQATCNTCRTRCDQPTCDTCSLRCPTINPHVFTCGPQCMQP